MGCKITRAYAAVPLAAGYRVSIGMTTVNDHACVGVFADTQRADDADRLAHQIDAAIDELLGRLHQQRDARPPTQPQTSTMPVTKR
jgi:uncharacterized protein DUF1298